jgi:type III secretion protein J
MAMPSRAFCALLLTLALTACGEQVELHSQLSEQDANEVIAELADKRIQAHKRPDKEGVTVLVEANAITRAVRVLDAAGLPRRSRSSLGDIFRKEGVISTPLEERARYIYALSQELEATLSQIDGVIVARVHVVLPERVAPGEPVQPASASVFIKHDADLDPDSVRPRVRRMVASSIPGMASAADNESKLAVVFVPAVAYREQQSLAYFGPFLLPSEDLGFWRRSLYSGLALAVLLIAGLCLWLKPQWRPVGLGRPLPTPSAAPAKPPVPLKAASKPSERSGGSAA